MVEFNLVASILLVVFFLLLFFKKRNALPNKILALILLDPGLNFIDNILILEGFIPYFPWSYFFVQITGALFAPLTYYYITMMTGPKPPKAFKWLRLVSLLIILYGVGLAVAFGLLPPDEQADYLKGVTEGPYPANMELYSAVLFIHQLIYFTGNIFQIRRYKARIKQTMSAIDKVKIRYLYRFVALFWILTFITVALYLTIDTVYVEYIALPAVMLTILFFILYYAINEHALFTQEEYENHLKKILPAVTISEEEAEVSGEVSGSTERALVEQIYQTLEAETLYKDPNLQIQQVSDRMNIAAYKLSKAIKDEGTSFYEMIRRFRIQKAKELLLDPQCNYSIEAIAYEVGFNSRAAFYRAFKKYEDVSPSEYTKH